MSGYRLFDARQVEAGSIGASVMVHQRHFLIRQITCMPFKTYLGGAKVLVSIKTKVAAKLCLR